MMGERKQRDKTATHREERIKVRGWTEAGHFTAHTSHNRNQELYEEEEGEIRERQRERASPRKPRKRNL